MVASWGLPDGTTLMVHPLCSLIGPKIQELEIGKTMKWKAYILGREMPYTSNLGTGIFDISMGQLF